MTVIDTLRNEFSFTYSVRSTASGKSILEIESQWKGNTEGVSKVVLYLSGTDPMSGLPLAEDKVRFEISAVNTRAKSGAADFYGTYLIHADAYLDNKEKDVIRDFNPPVKIELSGSTGKPYITYFALRTSKGLKGWTEIEVESNCWRRCNGHLWVQCNGSTQLLPEFKSNTLRCLLPVANREYVLLTSDPTLPGPEKIKKEG